MKSKLTRLFLLPVLIAVSLSISAQTARQTLLFNAGWKFHKGDTAGADKPGFNDNNWRSLDLRHDRSIEGPFDQQWASSTAYLPTGIGWYHKTFALSRR